MSSIKKYNLVAKVGEYEKDGVTKHRWFTCGSVFENAQGQLSAKIDGMPTGSNWDGWLQLFESKSKLEISTPADKKEQDIDNLPF